MHLLAGTSGYSYKEWKGTFYPEEIPDADWLPYYAERLDTVEINNTFYRMPKAAVMVKWAEQVPDHFVFVIKASQRITHKGRLKDTDDSVAYLWQNLAGLGRHLGPILFQLPPYFRKDVPRLADFLAALPDGLRPVFEFRHASWLDDEVHEVLRKANAARCVADKADDPTPAIVPTADWGYLRLRQPSYDDTALESWAERIAAQPWREAFVFFKHEDAGTAPQMALRLRARFEPGST